MLNFHEFILETTIYFGEFMKNFVTIFTLFSTLSFVCVKSSGDIDPFIKYSEALKAEQKPEKTIAKNDIFRDETFENLNLTGAQITKTTFKSSVFNNVLFKNINILIANFIDSELSNCDFSNAELYTTKFVSTEPKRFFKCIFDKASMTGCRFKNMTFDQCSFVGLKLNTCFFENCSFKGVDFTQANMFNVVFTSCEFYTEGYEFPCENFDLMTNIQGVMCNFCMFYKKNYQWYHIFEYFDETDNEDLEKILTGLGFKFTKDKDFFYDGWLKDKGDIALNSITSGISYGVAQSLGNNATEYIIKEKIKSSCNLI